MHWSQARVRLLTAGPLRCAEEGLWLPNTERPAWLDGSLPGDRGFDPLGLSRPTEYLQVRPPLPPHHWHSRLQTAPCCSDRSQYHVTCWQSIIIATAAALYTCKIPDFRCLPADPARCACQRARMGCDHTCTQVDIDELDQNKAVNKAGGIIGKFSPVPDNVSTDSLQPYSEVRCRLARSRGWPLHDRVHVLHAVTP